MRLLGVVGPSGAGKTTLVERLVPRLAGEGRVATVKSIHHDVEVDQPGKDTHRHREAGAVATVGITPSRTFGFAERGKADATSEADSLQQVLAGFADRGVATALVEGFGDATIPKVAVGEPGGTTATVPAPAEPVVAAVGSGEADLDGLLAALDGLRAFETATSVAARERSAAPARSVAVASATGRGVAEPADWTLGRLDDPIRSIRDDASGEPGVERATGDVCPPVVADGDAAVHVAVVAEDRERAFDAAATAGGRLRAALDGPTGVEYRLYEP